MIVSDQLRQKWVHRRRQRHWFALITLITSSLFVCFNIFHLTPKARYDEDNNLPLIIESNVRVPIRLDQGLNSTSFHDYTSNDNHLPFMQSTGMRNESIEEFQRSHRNYLLLRQRQQQNTPYTSSTTTLARERDSYGNIATTFAFAPQNSFGFGAGFRNQIMALTMLVLHANDDGHDQILLDSLWHKDTYGTNKFDPFEFYFDVETWNSYSKSNSTAVLGWSSNSRGTNRTNPPRHPNRLPRLVLYNQSLHDQWDIHRSNYKDKDAVGTRPYAFKKGFTRLAAGYQFYVKGKGRYAVEDDPNQINRSGKSRNPAEILMLQGALKPHPVLQAIVDRSKIFLQDQSRVQFDNSEGQNSSRSGSSFRYMTLHARVEPDMQHHPVCKEKKVLSLQEIVNMIEAKWAAGPPPVDVVFIPINRQYLEKEGTLPQGYKHEIDGNVDTKSAINWVAVDNLKVLNRLTDRNSITGGMWDGTVKVVELGSKALKGSIYEHRPSLSGSILNYFLGLDAHIFVGSEVSSFAHDILAARFYRGLIHSKKGNNGNTIAYSKLNTDDSNEYDIKHLKKNNFKYLPSGGLQEWITDDMNGPPGFLC